MRERVRIKRRPPPPVRVRRELDVVPLSRHPGDDKADPRPAPKPPLHDVDDRIPALEEREAERGREEGATVGRRGVGSPSWGR